MWLSSFRGGVHPDGFKELSTQHPIGHVPLPPKLYVPVRQHTGSASIPLVKPGERVLKGQLIGKAGSGLSAPIHAPTSGIVEDVRPVTAAHPSGHSCTAVIIDVDGLDTPIETNTVDDPFSLTREELADRIFDAGIVGMGGAAFPAAVKLNSATKREIDTLIINGGECEPYLTADDFLMRERANGIVEGSKIIRYIIGAKKVVVAIEDNKREAIASMKEATKQYDYIEVKTVPTRYPMGSAKQMIHAVTGKEVPAGGRSSDVGVLMHNVATAYAIHQCLAEGMPLISRIVTVSGGSVVEPRNVEALIGTPIEHLIAQCGGTKSDVSRIILGGPMMGQIMPSMEVPLIKGAAGVLVLENNEITQPSPSPCIRCGRCLNACPMGLVPLEMANHSKANDFDGAKEFGLSDCILCGSCSFVCPSHIPLVQYFQYAKGMLNHQRLDEQHVERTKQLSEARRLRQEKEAAAKAAAKAAKANKRKKTPKKAAAKTAVGE